MMQALNYLREASVRAVAVHLRTAEVGRPVVGATKIERKVLVSVNDVDLDTPERSEVRVP